MNSTSSSDINRCDYYENIVKYCDKEFIFNPKNTFEVKKVCVCLNLLYNYELVKNFKFIIDEKKSNFRFSKLFW